MHSPESDPRGVETRPPSFFPWRLQWGYLFSSGGPTPTTPRQFLPRPQYGMPNRASLVARSLPRQQGDVQFAPRRAVCQYVNSTSIYVLFTKCVTLHVTH